MATKGSNIIACPNCLEPVKLNSNVCSYCGVDLNISDLEKIDYAAHNIHYWAWQYGKNFYDEYKKTGKIESRYFITPLEILSYLASIVAAGIIGNVAYDLVKTAALKAIRKLRSKHETASIFQNDETDEDNLEILNKLAKAYVACFIHKFY
jgi:hypothetical protein